MKIRKKILISLALSVFLVVNFHVPNVLAYVSGPIQSGFIYSERPTVGDLAASYAAMVRYDAESGGNDPFFFPGIESHSSYDPWQLPYFFVTGLKITVTGTKPDGSPISGLEFTNLAALDSPHNSGGSWYDVLAVLFDVINDLSPPGASPLLKFGQSASICDYDGSSAWAKWKWNGLGFPIENKGLQFRFSLHCDPDLPGTYTLNIHYYVEIMYRSPAGGMYPAASKDVYETIEYLFGNPLNPLTVLAEANGTSLTNGDVYIDGQWRGLTGQSFVIEAGIHTVRTNHFWESGYTGYRYGFQHWNDSSTENLRTIMIDGDMTIKAHFYKKWCPGDINDDGYVNVVDVGLLSNAWGSERGDANWDSSADLNYDSFVNVVDLGIVSDHWMQEYEE